VPGITTVRHGGWTIPPGPPGAAAGGEAALERGEVLFLPGLAFAIEPDERPLFSPAILSSAKNASFNPSTGRIGGTSLGPSDAARLARMMSRFSGCAAALAAGLCPSYGGRLERARASFRPAEIAGRASSWRKDDTRLHVDSFPATPVAGRRILRVFANVNPEGRPRTWRIGDEFEAVARRFAPRLRLPWPGGALLLRALGVTKSPRTPYDALMLQLHDLMKADRDFQDRSPQAKVDFPAGSTWVAFTDQVSHAAMSGQYQLEQTLLLPLDAMVDGARSPLRVLERLEGRPLV
jgi:hypothetical protein